MNSGERLKRVDIRYIEFRKPSFRYDPAVGEFYIEKSDSNNQKPAAVIWLFLSVIDHVQVDPGIQKKLGFIPSWD